MAEVPVRWKCVMRIIELARTHEDLDGVNVEPGWPGEEAGAECIYLDHLEGDLNVPVTKAGRVAYDDIFEMSFAVRVVADGMDRNETMLRVFELVGALHDVVALKSQLDNLDGVVSARVSHGRQESYDVPPAGYFGIGTVVVTVHSRLW